MNKAKILVVEDEKVVATDIEECLNKLGYAVVGAAASGVGAIRKAVETDPDLVLMDIKLKGNMDGVVAAGELRDRLGIPVVYLTAYADGEILDRAKLTSPSGYVLKPFDERALRSAVEIALHRHPQEQRLVESERSLVSALRSIDEAVILTDHNSAITIMNRVAEKLTGWKQTEVRGKHLKDVFTTIHGRTGAIMRDPVRRVLREGVGMGLGDYRVIVDKQGTETWIRGSVVPLRDTDGDVIGAALVFKAADGFCKDEDIDAMQCRHSSRMETVGRLTGGIAKDFRKNLEAINSYGQQLRDRFESGHAGHDEIESILEVSNHAIQLANRLADFTQHRVARPCAIDLSKLIKDLEDLLESSIGDSIELLTVLSADTGEVFADPGHMEHLVMHLAMTCRDNMPSGGKLTIETSDIELLEEYARAHTRLEPGRYVLLALSHTGAVIPPGREKLEEAMPAVCELISMAGGDIRVRSEPGRITTYEIYLPRAD